MRALTEKVTEFAQNWIDGIADAPATIAGDVDEMSEQIRRQPPRDEPGSLEDALGTIAKARDLAFNTAGPGFMAYIPGGGVYTAALGDYLAASLNRYSGYWWASPVFAEIEWGLIRWMCELFGYPEAASGALTSGGSMANFSAVITARAAKLGEDFLKGTIYASDQAHHSVHKAAHMAGFPRDAVRVVPVDDQLRLELDALSSTIAADKRAGAKPFLLVASAGTTNTGAVDPLRDLRGVADQNEMWLHADAAYGGFFQLTERGSETLSGVELADSITLDPHKGLFLPYGTGALIVRNGDALRNAHAVGEIAYLKDLPVARDFADYSSEMTRHMRSLRLWLPLTLHGVGAFRETLDEKLDLATHLYNALDSRGDFDLPWEPSLSIVAFRHRSQGSQGIDTNKMLMKKINASQRVLLSPTEIDGVFWLRAAILAHRTHRNRIDELVEIIDEAVSDMSRSLSP
ncbi:MAG TPA: aminotransferase class V-fold PLP-dependent enzyme [Actinomycetota bacterium]|nr:aminotransferase class V-fold PLP-dependent enzyme [Actinomycetota bacterium]